MNPTELPAELLNINTPALPKPDFTTETQEFITSKDRRQIKKEKKASKKQPVTLTIFSIPLFRHTEVLLMAPAPLVESAPGRVRHKVADKWRRYDITKQKEGSAKARFYEWGVRKMESIDPSTRLLSNIPKNIAEITVVHGSNEFHDALYRELSLVAKTSPLQYTMKSILWSLALPFLAFVDALALGWPKVGTTLDVIYVCKNAKASKGVQRLRKALSSPSRIVDFAESDCLDVWRERVRQRDGGVLTDLDIVQLSSELQKPELAMPMMEIRRTYLRSVGRYDLITPDLAIAPHHPPIFVAI